MTAVKHWSRRAEGRFAPGRALVAVALFAGASAIGISLLQGLERGHASGRQPSQLIAETGDFSATAELVENTDPNRKPAPVRTSSDGAAASKPAAGSIAPPAAQAPPSEALPASSVRAVGAAGGATRPSTAVNQSNEPFSVALVVEDGSNLKPLAQDIARRLASDGFSASVTTLDEAGRPDVVLLLGTNQEQKASGWYCDPGAPTGAALSRTLLDSLSVLPPDSSGSASGGSGPSSSFPCADINVGRARVTASLVELPAGVLRQAPLVATASESMTSGIERYFDQNGVSVRNQRSSTQIVWPATGSISSYFGPSHPLGIDIAQSDGPITAATDGVVAFAGGDECCSYGLYVVLDAPNGLRTVYAHLDSFAVKKGQKVRQGQKLGIVGCTGHCTGPHLHFEVIQNGARQDPLRYLP